MTDINKHTASSRMKIHYNEKTYIITTHVSTVASATRFPITNISCDLFYENTAVINSMWQQNFYVLSAPDGLLN